MAPTFCRVTRLPLRRSDEIAVAFCALSIALAFVADAVRPGEACDYDNHDVFVVEARRSGLVLYGSALAILTAASLFIAGAITNRRRGVLRAVAAAISLAAAGFVAFLGLLEYIHFDCLE